jgi:exonuclease SbcC
VTQRETADAAAVQAREAASLARQEAEPLLRQAGHQEKLIAQAEDALKKSEATAQERERLVKAAQAKRAALQRQSETAEKTRVQHQAWLKERADWEPLATQWTHWRQTLLDYREAAREARDASKLLREISVEFDAAAKTEADLAARFQTASQGREQALLERQKRLEEAEKISAGVDLDGEMDRLKAVGEVFNDLKVLAESLARASKERQERVAEAEACEKRAAALKAESEESRRAAEIAEARLKDAQAERERWIRVSSLDARRGELVQGEPCSLCGSKDHPWAQDAPPAAAEFLRQSEESVQKLSATLETSRRHATESAAGAQAAAQTAVRDRREARKREEAIAENLMGWEIAVQKLAEPERPGFKPSDADASDRIERELAGLRERWSELKTKRGERQDLLKKADKALDRADKLRGEADRFQESRDAQTRRKAEAQNQKTRVEDALARHKREMAQAARALEDAFPIGDNWRQRLEADPDAFAENCAQRVQEWSRRSEELQAAQSNLTALAPDLAAAEVETATRREALEEARQSVEMNQALRADLRRRRGELFGGRSVEEETRRLEEAVRAAEAARETASKLLQEAKSALAAAEERRAGASRRAEEARQTLLVRRDELAAALVRLNVAEERLQAFLALDPAVHAERRAKIDSLKSERHRAETVLEERRRARSERENAAAPGPAPETLAHQLADAETKRDSFEGELSRIRATLQRDDETRARAGALLPLLQEKERESERWAKLSELIGSADGMKFTRYAQGATLELLVDEANHHLRSLAPRYALARVPNAELELLIIDRDMGDERRPVNTLSGGETFLASLALALGLSSLSSGGRRTGSLFIDEGFGTLDRDTLDRAVALLESLPSGLGCQVGIISHVEGLSERVAARARVEPIAAGRARLIVEATGGGS